MSNRIRAVPILLPLFLLLGCADDHWVTGPDEPLLLDVLASTSSATGYEVVRLTYPFQYPSSVSSTAIRMSQAGSTVGTA